MKLNNKTYDILKFIVQTVLPAVLLILENGKKLISNESEENKNETE